MDDCELDHLRDVLARAEALGADDVKLSVGELRRLLAHVDGLERQADQILQLVDQSLEACPPPPHESGAHQGAGITEGRT